MPYAFSLFNNAMILCSGMQVYFGPNGKVRPAGYCTPRHGVPFNSLHEGSKCVGRCLRGEKVPAGYCSPCHGVPCNFRDQGAQCVGWHDRAWRMLFAIFWVPF